LNEALLSAVESVLKEEERKEEEKEELEKGLCGSSDLCFFSIDQIRGAFGCLILPLARLRLILDAYESFI